MLREYGVWHFRAADAAALALMRQSVRNREVRDFLDLDGPYVHFDGFCDMTGGLSAFAVDTRHLIMNSTNRNPGGQDGDDAARRQLCDSLDFRELCRIFGERYAAVSAFELKTEHSFRHDAGQRAGDCGSDHVMAYMRIEVVCRRMYDSDRIAFFELVRYRSGDNFDLYWDGLPDIDLAFTSGRAKGCNVYMRSLAVYDIQSDGIPAGVRFRAILPVITALSRIAAGQYDYIIPYTGGSNPCAAQSDARRVWAAPDGVIRYAPAGECIRLWRDCFRDSGMEADDALIADMTAASPGVTFLIPEKALLDGDRAFLSMQKKIYKDSILLSGDSA